MGAQKELLPSRGLRNRGKGVFSHMLCSLFQSYKSVKAFLPHQGWNEREGLTEVIFQTLLTVRLRIPKLWAKIELLEKTSPPILTSSWPREFYNCDSGNFTTLKETDSQVCCAAKILWEKARKESSDLPRASLSSNSGYWVLPKAWFNLQGLRFQTLVYLSFRAGTQVLKALKSKKRLIEFN